MYLVQGLLQPRTENDFKGVFPMGNKVIAAVRSTEEFERALEAPVTTIFHLSPDLHTLSEIAKKAHSAEKKVFIHLDLATGIGKDKSGILYAKTAGIDGIISTRVNIIRTARECGMFTVQRFFIVDSKSVDTTLEAVKSAKPDMIEIMPGAFLKAVTTLRKNTDTPIIAGGLIDSAEEVKMITDGGATAISTAKASLWSL